MASKGDARCCGIVPESLPSKTIGDNEVVTMPRQPRLDAPETLQHVMVRGLERRVIFREDTDC